MGSNTEKKPYTNITLIQKHEAKRVKVTTITIEKINVVAN